MVASQTAGIPTHVPGVGPYPENFKLVAVYGNFAMATDHTRFKSVDANGKVAEGFRAQAVQVMENIKTALGSVGGGFEHVVKLTSYLTNLEANGAEFREVRGSYFPNKAALPASTLLQISRLANPAYLVEVEVIAILPPKA